MSKQLKNIIRVQCPTGGMLCWFVVSSATDRAVGTVWEIIISSSSCGRCVPACTLVDPSAASLTAERAALALLCLTACRDNSTGELGCDKDCPTVVTVTDNLGRSFKASFEPIKVASGQQRWQQVSAAIYFTCATTVEGTAMCWVRGQPSCNSWTVCSADCMQQACV